MLEIVEFIFTLFDMVCSIGEARSQRQERLTREKLEIQLLN